MTHFVPASDLDVTVARRIVAPRVERLLHRVEEEAQRLAPGAKVWMTVRDERVRPSHVYADGQEVPDNLRFKLPKVNTGNDVNDIRAGFDLARTPRDPDLPIGNRINCRCEDIPVLDAIAREIHSTPVLVTGTKVRGQVVCTYPRAAEAEYGTDRDAGAHFMRGAINRVAAETRGTSARRT